MKICPDCRRGWLSTATDHCVICDWQLSHQTDIPIWLSRADQDNPIFRDYIANYETISIDDQNESIQSTSYRDAQTAKILQYLRNRIQGNVLELGVGHGGLFDKLSRFPLRELVGIDISLTYLSDLREKHSGSASTHLMVANAENIPYRNHFDLIIATDVAEHVINLGNFLISVREALTPDGTFLIRTPLNEDIVKYSTYRNCPYPWVHLRAFSAETLRLQLESAGFVVEEVQRDGFEYYCRWTGWKEIPGRIIQSITRKKHVFSDNHEDIPMLANWLAALVFKPIEITMICHRAKDLQ